MIKVFCDLCEKEISFPESPPVKLTLHGEIHPHDGADMPREVDACSSCLRKLSPIPVNGRLSEIRKICQA